MEIQKESVGICVPRPCRPCRWVVGRCGTADTAVAHAIPGRADGFGGPGGRGAEPPAAGPAGDLRTMAAGTGGPAGFFVEPGVGRHGPTVGPRDRTPGPRGTGGGTGGEGSGRVGPRGLSAQVPVPRATCLPVRGGRVLVALAGEPPVAQVGFARGTSR